MTAQNHALMGALIGLTIANPFIALPLAFLSHFALDAIPHYDPEERDQAKLFKSRRFIFEFLIVGGSLCLLLVVVLAITRPQHWLPAAVGAFLATSPDLCWLPGFIRARKTGVFKPTSNWFIKLHSWVQWKTSPRLIWVEAAWFLVMSGLVATKL